MGDNEGNRQLSTAEMKKHVAELERQAQAEREKAGERTGKDREVEQEIQTVRPGSDAPSRANITPDGSGADAERG